MRVCASFLSYHQKCCKSRRHYSLSHLARLPDCESDGEAGDEDDTTGVVIIFIVVPQDDTEDLEDVKWIQYLKEIWID